MAVDISSLSPDTLERFLGLQGLARDNGMTIVATSARRTCAQQNAIYAEGRTAPGTIRTNARGCYSWHIFGRAFDIEITEGPKNYNLLGALGKSLGLEWGGDWQGAAASLHDVGHFQYRPGLALSDVCPDPDHCTSNTNIDVPGPGKSLEASPWMSCTCRDKDGTKHTNGPRFRLLSNGQIEVEGIGTPVKTLPDWVLKYAHEVRVAAIEFDFPDHLIDAFMAVEGSRGDPMATSGAAFGLMQLTLGTAKMLYGAPLTREELGDPLLNIRLGTKYLRQLWDRTKGNIVEMSFSYNAGGVYCGFGKNARAPCDPSTEEGCITPAKGKPYKIVPCPDMNKWGVVADCHGTYPNVYTYDYASDVIAYANSALFLVPDGPATPVDPPGPPSPLPADKNANKVAANTAFKTNRNSVWPWLVGTVAGAMILFPFVSAPNAEKARRPRQR